MDWKTFFAAIAGCILAFLLVDIGLIVLLFYCLSAWNAG